MPHIISKLEPSVIESAVGFVFLIWAILTGSGLLPQLLKQEPSYTFELVIVGLVFLNNGRRSRDIARLETRIRNLEN